MVASATGAAMAAGTRLRVSSRDVHRANTFLSFFINILLLVFINAILPKLAFFGNEQKEQYTALVFGQINDLTATKPAFYTKEKSKPFSACSAYTKV